MARLSVKILLIGTIFVGFSQQIHAGSGSHGVNNGGDISELQAIQIWTQSEEMVNHCLKRSDLCGTSSSEAQFLSYFVENSEQRGPIHFQGTPESWVYQTPVALGATIEMNSLQLYENDWPIDYRFIANFVFEALFYQYGFGPENSKILAEKISQFWNFQSNYHPFVFNGQKTLLVWVSSLNGISVFFDLPEDSSELTSLFQTNLPCGGMVQDLPVIFSQQSDGDTLKLRGKAKGTCQADSPWAAEFQLIVKLTKDQKSIDLENSRLRYFNAQF